MQWDLQYCSPRPRNKDLYSTEPKDHWKYPTASHLDRQGVVQCPLLSPSHQALNCPLICQIFYRRRLLVPQVSRLNHLFVFHKRKEFCTSEIYRNGGHRPHTAMLGERRNQHSPCLKPCLKPRLQLENWRRANIRTGTPK